MYQVIWNGDAAGLYFNSKLVASAWQLQKDGYNLSVMVGFPQSLLCKIAAKYW